MLTTQTHSVTVITRIRPSDEQDSIILVDTPTSLTVNPLLVQELGGTPRRSSLQRPSSGRQSSMGCSSLIPAGSATPRGMIGKLLGAMPISTTATLQAEQFHMANIHAEEATAGDLFTDMVGDVNAALKGYRSTIISYGVPDSGKSYTLFGTLNEKGLVCRSLEYLYANKPKGAQVFISFVGLDDDTYLDYLVQDASEAPERAPTFKSTVDGGFAISDAIVVDAEDYKSAWDTVVSGLNLMRSERHQIVTVNVQLPATNEEDACLVGTLQFAEINVPSAHALVSNSVSRLNDVVTSLVDKSYTGEIDYSQSPLTSYLKPAFGGNSRTFVILNVHSTLDHFQDTVQTLGFGEHCRRLKNIVSPHLLRGFPAAVSLSQDPAALIKRMCELRDYNEELEAENDDLRDQRGEWVQQKEQWNVERQQLLAQLEETNKTHQPPDASNVAGAIAESGRIAQLEIELEAQRERVREMEEMQVVAAERERNRPKTPVVSIPAQPMDPVAANIQPVVLPMEQELSQHQDDALAALRAENAALRAENRAKEVEMEERENALEQALERASTFESQLNTFKFLSATATHVNQRTKRDVQSRAQVRAKAVVDEKRRRRKKQNAVAKKSQAAKKQQRKKKSSKQQQRQSSPVFVEPKDQVMLMSSEEEEEEQEEVEQVTPVNHRRMRRRQMREEESDDMLIGPSPIIVSRRVSSKFPKKKAAAKPKSIKKVRKCSKCGDEGHISSNKNCPMYENKTQQNASRKRPSPKARAPAKKLRPAPRPVIIEEESSSEEEFDAPRENVRAQKRPARNNQGKAQKKRTLYNPGFQQNREAAYRDSLALTPATGPRRSARKNKGKLATHKDYSSVLADLGLSLPDL